MPDSKAFHHVSLQQLFTRAIHLHGDERERYIAELAASRPDLAARVAALLSADATQDSGSGIRGEDALVAVRSSAGVGGDAGILTGRVIAGFEVGELIGQGGSGAVYRAQQIRPARVVAFKSMRPEVAGPKARRRFELEAEHLALLSHPNIASVIAAGFDDETRVSWLATEFVEGARSIVRCAVEQGLELRDRVSMMASACHAVSGAHAKGVLHRDLKPSNILVGSDGAVKVIDFGLARTLTPADGRSLATETGEIVGTILYMSPEQCSGDPRRIDVRSDVFALGAVMYELLAGQPPRVFDSVPLPAAIRMVSEREIPRPSDLNHDVPRDLDAVVAMACALDPESRYPSVQALADDLSRYIAGEPVLARPPGALRRFRSWIRREPTVAGAIGAAILATVACVIALWVYALNSREQAQRSEAISRHVYDQLVPAASKLTVTQHAQNIREIHLAAYDLSVVLNGANHQASAGLALKLAFDWLKGDGYDPVESERWARVAFDSACATPNLGPSSTVAVQARCIEAWAAARRASIARVGASDLRRMATERLLALLPVVEARDDVDPASDSLAILGEFAEASGELEQATDFYRRAIARSTRLHSESDVMVVQTRSYLVDALVRQGDFGQALAELDELLRIQREHERGFGPWTIRFAMQRGEALLKLERFAEAEQQLVEADELVRDRLGPNHGMRNRIRNYLRQALSAQGRDGEAQREWTDVQLAE